MTSEPICQLEIESVLQECEIGEHCNRRSVCFPDTSSIQRCTACVQHLAVSGEMHYTRREGEPALDVSAVIDSQCHNKFNRLQTLLKLLPVDAVSKSAECFLS